MFLRNAVVGREKKYSFKKLKLIDARVMVTLCQYSMLPFSKVSDNIPNVMALKLDAHVYTTNRFFKWKQGRKELAKF